MAYFQCEILAELFLGHVLLSNFLSALLILLENENLVYKMQNVFISFKIILHSFNF